MYSNSTTSANKKNKVNVANITLETSGVDSSITKPMQLIESQFGENPEQLTEEQKLQIQQFLEYAIGNMTLNGNISILIFLDKSESGIGTFSIGCIKELSYRTRNLETVAPHIDNLYMHYQDVFNDPTKPYTGPKLTLEEYGMLYDIAKLNSTMELLQKKGLIGNNPKLVQLLEYSRKAKEIVSFLDNNFDQQFKFPPGAVVVEHINSKVKVLQKEENISNHAVSTISKYGHTATGVSTEKEGKPVNIISHINPNYKEDKFGFRDYLYCEVYKINFEKLISPQAKAYLKKHLGDGWLEIVEKEYYRIEREMHDKAMMMHYHIKADTSYLNYSDIVLGKVIGHRSSIAPAHNPVDVMHEIYGGEQWDEKVQRKETRMICSEFTAKTMVTSIENLNGSLVTILKAKGVKEPCPYPLVRNPFSSLVKLENLDPESMISELKKLDSVKRVPPVNNQYVESRTSKKVEQEANSIKAKLTKIFNKEPEKDTNKDDQSFRAKKE